MRRGDESAGTASGSRTVHPVAHERCDQHACLLAAHPATPRCVLVNLGTPDGADRARRASLPRASSCTTHAWSQLPRWLWWPLLHCVILPLRSARVAKKYAAIWLPRRLAAGGAHAATGAGRAAAPAGAARRACDALWRTGAGRSRWRNCARDGVHRVLVLPLYPQYSTTTTASVADVLPGAHGLADAHGRRLPPRSRLGRGDRRVRSARIGRRSGAASTCCSRSMACRSGCRRRAAIRTRGSARPARARSPPRSAWPTTSGR